MATMSAALNVAVSEWKWIDRVALLDGRPGIVVTPRAGELMLLIRLAFTGDGRIAAIDVTGDPEKLRATHISAV